MKAVTCFLLWVCISISANSAYAFPQEERPIAMIKSMVLSVNKKGSRVAPFNIEAAPNRDALIKMADIETGRTLMLIYVRKGDVFETKVPLGDYEIRVATGVTWYGLERLFGKETIYYTCRRKDDPHMGQVVSFTKESWKERRGRRVYTYTTYRGHTFSMNLMSGGNVIQEPLAAENF